MGAIFGFLGFEDKKLLKQMSKLEEHRSLDGFKYYLDKKISFGQGINKIGTDYFLEPLTNENEDIILLFDGELFETEKIRKDLELKGHRFKTNLAGEIIIHFYEEEGANFIKKINGDFAFALYDKKIKKLILSSDHAGSKPLYYHHNKNEIIFASDIKPILQYTKIKKILDEKALDLMLTYLLIPTEKTLLKGIKRVMPSTYLTYKNNVIHTHTHFAIKEKIDQSKNEEFYITKIRNKLEKSIFDRINNKTKINISLGGLDSSIITGILSSKINNINTYSYNYGYETKDLLISRKISEKNKTNHKEIIVEKEDITDFYRTKIPFFNTPSIMDLGASSMNSIYNKIQDKKSYLFTGEGADPLFAGVRNENMKKYRRIITLPLNLRRLIGSLIQKTIHLFRPDRQEIIISILQSLDTSYLRDESGMFSKKLETLERLYANLYGTFFFSNYKGKTNDPSLLETYKTYIEEKDIIFLNKLMKLLTETKGYLEQLQRNEIQSTIQGLSNKTPYLDKRIINLSFTIPLKYKYKPRINKILLLKATKDLFPKNIKLEKTPVGIEAVEFYQTYFTDNKSSIENIYEKSRIYKSFKKDFLTKIFKPKQHKSFDSQFFRIQKIHALTTIGLWYEDYFNNENLKKFI